MSFKSIPRNTRNVVLGAGPLAAGLGFYEVAMAVFLPLEGLSATNVGLLFTTGALSAVTFSLPFAILSDRHGRKQIMFVGSVITALVITVPGLTSSFTLLESSAILGGVGEAMYLSTWNAYLADTTTFDVRASTFSLSFMTFTIALGVGSVIPAFFPLVNIDFLVAHRITFILLGLLSLISSFSVQRWAVKTKPKSSREGILPKKSLGVIMRFSLANMLIGLGAGLIIPLIPTWFLYRFQVTDVFSGPLIAASNFIMGVTAIFSPRIARRFGLVKGIVVAQASSMLFLLLVPFSPTAYIAAPLYVVRAVLMNMSNPLSDTFLMNMTAEDERATASSFNVMLWRLPNAASTSIGGSILSDGFTQNSMFLLNLPFYLCAALYVTSISIFYAIFRKTEESQLEKT
ncbi:MAG TPA: MFS transporter [Candidatus Acidoferrales bacterium]|nr:MFS transporter [Candidatus Acidoferrales bacterium]